MHPFNFHTHLLDIVNDETRRRREDQLFVELIFIPKIHNTVV